MSTQIGAVGATSSTASTSSSSATQKLTDDTKQKLEALGVDTSNITSEAQGQIALVQAQQQAQEKSQQSGSSASGKEEMESIKTEATTLANQLGVSVTSDEKISDIMDAIGTALTAKVSEAGNDQTKLAEVQSLQSQYDSLSSTLSTMQAQRSQAGASQLSAQNRLYHNI